MDSISSREGNVHGGGVDTVDAPVPNEKSTTVSAGASQNGGVVDESSTSGPITSESVPALEGGALDENDSNDPSKKLAASRSRPRLDLSALTNVPSRTGERRKGKSIFGQVLGTLNKAKLEDKERSASEAAKKRQSIEFRLHAKLSREQSYSRKKEEVKRDRITANRKEEELSIKDSIVKHRYPLIPNLANFLLTTDVIPREHPSPKDESSRFSPSSPVNDSPPDGPFPHPPNTAHPPAIYYLPKILTPLQQAFLARRRRQAEKRVGEEQTEWTNEKEKGMNEVRELRTRVNAVQRELNENGPLDAEEKMEDEVMDGVDEKQGREHPDAIQEDDTIDAVEY
ncbi:uncharacterized protein EI90DRAFT_2974750 [Cantharellus anzutake]|uniref:uncharacterized protein n=1 Tax=Cantharellus anzutake TaxID=1750568 RepID=UPI00190750DF|nr:uncharacterized protein EI90DRAFT_2974750 [Cantharellus anzutake]KAF8328245.1 hypothetical protein EI90DRAFT_2974750 [Cantharellus anzutake]